MQQNKLIAVNVCKHFVVFSLAFCNDHVLLHLARNPSLFPGYSSSLINVTLAGIINERTCEPSLAKILGPPERRKIEGMNPFRLKHVYMWKCHNEPPRIAILKKKKCQFLYYKNRHEGKTGPVWGLAQCVGGYKGRV
jgi:hypothetical protein